MRAAQDRSLGDGGRLFGRADALAEGGRARLRLPAKPGRTAREALVAVRFMAVESARPTDGVRTGLPKSVVSNPVARRARGRSSGRRGRALAAPHHAPGRGCGRGLRGRRPVPPPLGDRAAVPHPQDPGLRHRGGAHRRGRPPDQAHHGGPAAVTIQQASSTPATAAPGQSRLRPVTDAFDPDDLPLLEALCKSLEGRHSEPQRNLHPRGSLAYAAWVCARLGGWTGYYGKPGPDRHAPGLARVPSRQTRRRPHRPDQSPAPCLPSPFGRGVHAFAGGVAPPPPCGEDGLGRRPSEKGVAGHQAP